jgi:hypothetical protein
MKEIKVYFESECKRFILPENFEGLLQIVSSSFGISCKDIVISYLDEEGDRISISNSFDYDQLVKVYSEKLVRVHIDKSNTESVYIVNQTDSKEINEDYIQVDKRKEFLNIKRTSHISMTKKKVHNFCKDLKSFVEKEFDDKMNIFKKNFIKSLNHKIAKKENEYFFTESKTKNLQKSALSQNLKDSPIFSKSSKSNTIKKSKSHSHKTNSSHDLLNLNNTHSSKLSKKSNSLLNLTLPQNKGNFDSFTCRICDLPLNLSQSHFSCLICEDFLLCLDCEKEKVKNSHPHILIKTNQADFKHSQSLELMKKIKKAKENKSKTIEKMSKLFCESELCFMTTQRLAFNCLLDSLVIQLDETKFQSDYLNYKVNLVNLSYLPILPGAYLECIFDKSDVFGNKITFDEVTKPYEDFELSLMFYNFKNKPPGFYTSEWRLVRNCMEDENHLIFVFFLKKEDMSIYNVDILKKETNSLSSNEYNINLHNKEKNYIASHPVKFPDMFSEIIKKHQKNTV